MVDDVSATIFGAAGLISFSFEKHGYPIDFTHPVIPLLGDFLMRAVFGPSVRTRLSAAEITFLLSAWQGRITVWPRNFQDTCLFLRRWRQYFHAITVKDNIAWLWQHGYIFFGPSHVVSITFRQLNMDRQENNRHVVISAGRTFFALCDETRSTRHLSYFMYADGAMACMSAKYLPLYSMMRVVCADMSSNQMYSILRQRIKEDTK